MKKFVDLKIGDKFKLSKSNWIAYEKTGKDTFKQIACIISNVAGFDKTIVSSKLNNLVVWEVTA
jgi:hypothetical protein